MANSKKFHQDLHLLILLFSSKVQISRKEIAGMNLSEVLGIVGLLLNSLSISLRTLSDKDSIVSDACGTICGRYRTLNCEYIKLKSCGTYMTVPEKGNNCPVGQISKLLNRSTGTIGTPEMLNPNEMTDVVSPEPLDK
jgi:hypothetical protein